MQNKSEPSTPDGGSWNGGVNVFNEELQNKIEENALLHKQLQELSAQFDIHVRELQVTTIYNSNVSLLFLNVRIYQKGFRICITCMLHSEM